MKKIFLLISILFSVGLTSCDISDIFPPIEETPQTKKYEKDEEGFYILEDNYFSKNNSKSEVFYSDKIDGVDYHSDFRFYYGDQQIPVYSVNTNLSRVWSANPTNFTKAGVSTISLNGSATFKLQTNFFFKANAKLSPENKNIPFEIDQNRRVFTFTIEEPGQYTISNSKGITFHLFVNSANEELTKPIENTNVIRFKSGLHKKGNNSSISNDNIIRLYSNTTVILERGSVVEAGFLANNASNIHIIGEGIILGSHFERNASNGSRLIPFDFNYCNNISFNGITNLDPAGWCYNLYFCNNVQINNVKIITSRSNGDGISLQSCQNVTVKNSFVRSWDDSLVVKNYPRWDNRSSHGATKNIVFENCQIWNDLAQCMELGYETVGETFEDVFFTNITVIFAYHKAVISIHNANNANIKNIHFDNIVVEDAKMGGGDGNNYLIDIANIYSSTWSDQHTVTSLGQIDGVYINNVTVNRSSSESLIHISGTKDTRHGYDNNLEHSVKNFQIKNLKIANKVIDINSEKIRLGNYVYNFSIKS